jgi:hypothetical protein
VGGLLGGSARESKVFQVRIRRSGVVVFVLALLAPWAVVVGFSWRAGRVQAAAPAAVSTARPTCPEVRKCGPGPWGTLEYYELVTQPPDDFISPGCFSEAPAQWTFKDCSKPALNEQLGKIELTQAQRDAIVRGAECPAGTCVVKPGAELVLGLDPKARAQLYAVLARSPENTAQVDPFTFRPADIHAWLDQGGLAPSTVELVKRLLYPHAGRLLLSDCGLVMRQVADAEERMRLLRILFRRRAVFPRLRVTPDSDLQALTAYWGKGGGGVVVGPLLKSVPHVPEGVPVHVVLLLPNFARERLYTYPLPSSVQQAGPYNCYWAALNFFNDPPDDRLGRPEEVRKALASDYYPVPGSPTFGDVVLFSTPRHAIVHAAVYVADDLLFTKNGPSAISPWLLMTRDEVLASFPAYEKLEVTCHRLKKL